MNCLTEEELLASIDGGIPPNERSAVDGHLAGCKTCLASLQELESLIGDLTKLPELDEDAHVKGVMDCLGEQRPVAIMPIAARSRPRWMVLGGAFSAVAAAAAVVLFLRGPAAERPDPAFAARGGGASERTLARDVGLRVLTGAKGRALVAPLAPLTAGETVASETSFTAAYTNIHDKPAYLLLFAVDSTGAVHWLYPAYVSERENPPSVVLARATKEVAMETSVVLEAPAPGPLRIVSVLTEMPLHVHDIEDRRAEALAKDALERAFPQASIAELAVRVSEVPR